MLAAGEGTRFNDQYKPLAKCASGFPLITYALMNALKNVRDANFCVDIIIITGHKHAEVSDTINYFLNENKDSIKCNVQIIENADYQKGMFTSIKTAIAYAKGDPEASGVLITPFDVILAGNIFKKENHMYFDSILAQPDEFHVPLWDNGKRGHPLFLPSNSYDEVLSYTGRRGLKGFLLAKTLIEVPVSELMDDALIMDIDTNEDLNYFDHKYILCNPTREFFFEKINDIKFFALRHFETKKIGEKIFVGQIDLPLAKNIEPSIDKLIASAPFARLTESKQKIHIFSSDLLRARKTTEIVLSGLSSGIKFVIHYDKLLREIDLGEWDGKSIEDISQNFPEEYKRRGEDIYKYKRHFGENHYDVKYRGLRILYKVFMDDGIKSGDIVLFVGHKTSLTAIMSILKNCSFKDCEHKFKFNYGEMTEI